MNHRNIKSQDNNNYLRVMLNQIHYFLSLLVILITIQSCASGPKVLPARNTTGPEYGNLNCWAAHPDKDDMADLIPTGIVEPTSDVLLADVFFVHPTTYTGKAIDKRWNAPVDNEQLNDRTDASTIQFQASIFNRAGRIYAPRYRQAHIRTYFEEDEKLTKEVLDLAYSDVKNAFLYYLKYENQGRPFIIASHSQGTTHSVRLIKEVIDNQELKKQLIVAYLIGMPVSKDVFTTIPPCSTPLETGCFTSWRTYKRGHFPKNRTLGDKLAVHNPLSWKMDHEYISSDQNEGAVLRNFNKVFLHATDAQIENGILWAAKPKFPFSFLFTRKNYHVADFNFYYMNVRINAIQRVRKFVLGS